MTACVAAGGAGGAEEHSVRCGEAPRTAGQQRGERVRSDAGGRGGP